MSGRRHASIFDAPAPRIYSIPPDLRFLEELTRAVLESVSGQHDLSLADVEIYLPTRRAVRALQNTFASKAEGATFLPTIRALGDVDETELDFFKGAALDEADLPPAVSEVDRRIILARFVIAKDRAAHGRANWASALAAADELAVLLDAFHTEEIDPRILAEVAPHDLADHWARSLAFLEIVTDAWPAYLKEIGRMDPAERRVRLINRLVDAYHKATPAHPVMIAGTTGSAPAVARLIDVISNLPQGCVLLPGVDLSMDDETWRAIDDPHPQSGLKHLLEEGLGLSRRDVRGWSGAASAVNALRNEAINMALRPAPATDGWREWAEAFRLRSGDELARAFDGFSFVEMEDEEREADAIAIKIREVVAAPERTVFLVTPDRDLSRRVAAKLRRWDIFADDSAGVPLGNTRCGGYMRLVARLISEPADPAAFAAVMRHPLFGGVVSDGARNAMINAGDLALRGLKPENLDALAEKLLAAGDRGPLLAQVVERLRGAAHGVPSFAALLSLHIELAEMMAATDLASGADRLWRGEDGEACAARLADLAGAGDMIDASTRSDYHDIFDQLISDVAVRRRAPAHPRVAIFGPLEARLQSADVVILGGLNEGAWPRDAAIDAFLSRGMRKTAGLPSPERRIGLSAHDFAQLSAAPEVMVTRAKKAGGKPSTPSRWIVRLKNVLTGAGVFDLVDHSARYRILSARLDAAEMTPCPATAPAPPVDARPTRFSVTRIAKLLRDPYAIYAGLILRLRKLDEFNEQVDQRHIGNLFHRVFEHYVRDDPGDHNAEPTHRLMALFCEFASGPEFGAAHLPFWRARAEAAFDWFAEWNAARREEGAPAVIEGRGEWSFECDGRSYSLSATADRIDRLHSGAAAIFDYKTGSPPPTDKQMPLFSPQLPLTALIVREGGFETLGPVPVERFAYLKVQNRGRSGKDETGAEGPACEALIDETHAGLRSLLSHFNNAATAYLPQPRPQYVDVYGDFDHLARRAERRARDGDE